MLTIRLQRVGRTNHAEFRVVLCEHTKGPKSARYKEQLGTVNPHQDKVALDGERIKGWIAKGAQLSDTVHNLLVTHKVIDGKKINVLPKNKNKKTENKAA